MQITQKDLSSVTILKSTAEGDIIQARTYGGLNIVLLRRKNGDLEFLSSASTEIRSQAMAAKKYPRLGVPIIVKSKQEDTSPDTIGQIAHTIAESAHQAHVPAKDEAKLLTDQANYPEHLNTKLMTILKKKSRA